MFRIKDKWTCIVCSEVQPVLHGEVQREASRCRSCGATWRHRAIVLSLTLAAGIRTAPLPEWDENWSITGVGFDHAPTIFSRLPTKLSHTNTHLSRYPKLDLLDIDPQLEDSFSYAICSDVLEHVPGSVEKAVEGIFQILTKGGGAVLSVPLSNKEVVGEYYPEMKEFVIEPDNSVRWRTSSGAWQTDSNPEFHGGSGLVLAFRDFSYDSFTSLLKSVGFQRVMDVPHMPEYGVPYLSDSGVFIAWK